MLQSDQTSHDGLSRVCVNNEVFILDGLFNPCIVPNKVNSVTLLLLLLCAAQTEVELEE